MRPKANKLLSAFQQSEFTVTGTTMKIRENKKLKVDDIHLT